MQVVQLLLKYKWYVIPIILLIVISVVAYIFTTKHSQTNALISFEHVLGSSDRKGEEKVQCKLYVDVSGSVTRPNVYCFNEGELVIDALKRAGGFKKGKNASEYIRTNINLARPLVANEKLYFPYRNELQYIQMKYELVPLSNPSSKPTEGNACISLNEGTAEQLDSLNGVGPSTAQKIIDGRPYKKLEDLKNVSGIGDSLYSKILEKICL